ncbi:MFS transporter [Paenibacillus rigui]|uniref:MFS transporter n=1 Tax=Paenibacillus rigui TaxID=554312 RepID=A0A229UUF9_9BACL|nr:MFS transporter [Paenibacillus rigui]OXM87048.1 MFS transporter [Paenibacillus rigui]
MTNLSTGSPVHSALLRNRVLQVILTSALFLQIGIWVRNIAILLYVTEQTNKDPFAISMISIAEFAPIFLFSFIGGTFADRWLPKRTMVGSDLLSALSVFIVLLGMSFGGWQMVFLATLVSSILSQFSQPAGMKLFKLYVPEELMQAGMSLYQTLFAIFMILGPGLGTFIFQQCGIRISIGIVGIAFFLSAASLMLLPADRHIEVEKKDSSIFREMKLGFRYVLASSTLKILGWCFVLAGLALGLIQPLAIFLVTERLALPKEYLQWLLVANGIAMMIGGGATMAVSKKLPPQHLLSLGIAISAVGIFLSGLSTQLWLTIAANFINGLAYPAIHIGFGTLILKNAEEAFVGRVNGFLTPLFTGAMVLTMGISGWVKASVTLFGMYSAAAVLLVVAVVIMIPLLKEAKQSQTA